MLTPFIRTLLERLLFPMSNRMAIQLEKLKHPL